VSERTLESFFRPKNVAVIGASERPGTVGRAILWNLISSPFGGAVLPVNPKHGSVLGIKAYPSIREAIGEVDLAVVATPAVAVPGVIAECAAAGVKAAIVVSAGFRETGAAGLELERQVLAEARRGGMRIIGPNCLGVMCPITGLNATFANAMARPGNVGFISQSGALCTAILDWSLREAVGFSAFISIGSMTDVGWGDLIQYLGDDPHTQSIILYIESIGDARAFLSAAREVALTKPVIALKAGRTEAAAKAAASHTGALAGSDEVLDAAFRRCGVLRVNNISDLFYMSEVLAKQPRPKGPCLTIVTNAGGPGVLATDALISQGACLAELSDKTIAELDRILPPHWSRRNPIDMLGDASPERYAKVVEIAAKDPASAGLLVILTPQGMTNPTLIAEQIQSFAKLRGRPILASWMGGASVAAGEDILARAGVPCFPYPDTAARMFHYMWRYSYNLKGLYETPAAVEELADAAGGAWAVRERLRAIRERGRTLLTEKESKQALAAYGIPVVPTEAATSPDEAVERAARIGYPVVLKLDSETITHKTDVGGVRLNLADEAAVRAAYRAIEASVREKAGAEHFLGVTVQPMIRTDGYELILGSAIDSQFGPVLLFGAGGQMVEVFRDRAMGLPPLNTTLARRMMEQTKIYGALKGIRGRKPVDLDRLEHLLVAFSRLVVEQPWIREIDINPLLASAEGLVALDARVVLHGLETPEQSLPKPAIRPYPAQYVQSWRLKTGEGILIRPICPEDEPLMVRFHEPLSEQSVYLRYFHMIALGQRIAHDRLTRICFVDYTREIALVAERKDPASGERQIIGVGRLVKVHGQNDAELAVLVSDGFQRLGLGTELARRLVEIARDEKCDRVVADLLPENTAMQCVFRRLGFDLRHSAQEDVIKAALPLDLEPATVGNAHAQTEEGALA
jgi:acetyltransferase